MQHAAELGEGAAVGLGVEHPHGASPLKGIPHLGCMGTPHWIVRLPSAPLVRRQVHIFREEQAPLKKSTRFSSLAFMPTPDYKIVSPFLWNLLSY